MRWIFLLYVMENNLNVHLKMNSECHSNMSRQTHYKSFNDGSTFFIVTKLQKDVKIKVIFSTIQSKASSNLTKFIKPKLFSKSSNKSTFSVAYQLWIWIAFHEHWNWSSTFKIAKMTRTIFSWKYWMCKINLHLHKLHVTVDFVVL